MNGKHHQDMFDVIVVGSGLSGQSAAFELAEKGKRILILERENFIGGRTASWDSGGMMVESGLHRVLGFYKAFPDLLKRAGIEIDDIVIWEDKLSIMLPDGGPKTELTISPLHAPIETIADLLGNNDFLSLDDKISVLKLFEAGFESYSKEPRKLDKQTLAQYARDRKISQEIILRLLTPLSAGIFFLPPDKYSAFSFFGLFAPFLKRLAKFRIGSFAGGMSEVMAAPLAEALRERGVELKTGIEVKQILHEFGLVSGLKDTEGIAYSAPNIIVATSISACQLLIKESFPKQLSDFDRLLSLPTMSALTVQFELTEPFLPHDLVTFGPGTILASFAEQSRTTFRGPAGRLSVIIEQPEKYLNFPEQELLALIYRDATRLGLELKSKVKNFRIVAHHGEFYDLAPGQAFRRPKTKTAIPGLSLAGDYVDQPYLSTMEGAVVAGELAARSVLE